MPYSVLLHRGTREALGVPLEGAIVVLDEAHNIIDAVNSAHAARASLRHVSAAVDQLDAYWVAYRDRLGPRNAMRVRQLLALLQAFAAALHRGPPAQGAASDPAPRLLDVSEFLILAGVDHFNVYDLIHFASASNLANKVRRACLHTEPRTPLRTNLASAAVATAAPAPWLCGEAIGRGGGHGCRWKGGGGRGGGRRRPRRWEGPAAPLVRSAPRGRLSPRPGHRRRGRARPVEPCPPGPGAHRPVCAAEPGPALSRSRRPSAIRADAGRDHGPRERAGPCSAPPHWANAGTPPLPSLRPDGRPRSPALRSPPPLPCAHADSGPRCAAQPRAAPCVSRPPAAHSHQCDAPGLPNSRRPPQSLSARARTGRLSSSPTSTAPTSSSGASWASSCSQ